MSATIETHTDAMRTDYVITGTRLEVDAAMDTLLRQYHPMGYGTSFSPAVTHDDGTVTVYGYRYNSCD